MSSEYLFPGSRALFQDTVEAAVSAALDGSNNPTLSGVDGRIIKSVVHTSTGLITFTLQDGFPRLRSAIPTLQKPTAVNLEAEISAVEFAFCRAEAASRATCSNCSCGVISDYAATMPEVGAGVVMLSEATSALNAALSLIAISDSTLRSRSIPLAPSAAMNRLYWTPCARQAALMRAIQSWRNSRFRLRRSR